MARKERVVSLEVKVEYFSHENCGLKDAVSKLELDLSSRVSEVSSLHRRVDAFKFQPAVLPVELQSVTNKIDRYQQLRDPLTHDFDF